METWYVALHLMEDEDDEVRFDVLLHRTSPLTNKSKMVSPSLLFFTCVMAVCFSQHLLSQHIWHMLTCSWVAACISWCFVLLTITFDSR